jgi:hypothetical protein
MWRGNIIMPIPFGKPRKLLGKREHCLFCDVLLRYDNTIKACRKHRARSPFYRKGVRKYKREYNKERRKRDIRFRLMWNLRSRINRALERNSKTNHTLKLIGCSTKFLKKYLENQFTKGMTWNNWGKGKNKWEIDHIKPCYAFDLSKKSEQLKCFNYKNLRPLWAIDNQQRNKI